MLLFTSQCKILIKHYRFVVIIIVYKFHRKKSETLLYYTKVAIYKSFGIVLLLKKGECITIVCLHFVGATYRLATFLG